MARQKGVGKQFTPVRGFVTEFTDTRFPADAAIDLDNVVIDVDGSVRRRGGCNYEVDYVINDINGASLTTEQYNTYALTHTVWDSAGKTGAVNMIVVQVGLVLQFYSQEGAVSSNLIGELDLTSFATNVARAVLEPLSMDSGIGNLYVAGQYLNTVQVSFDPETNTFTPTGIEFEIRDFDGVDDGLAVDERPTTLSPEHEYNLRNQGWPDDAAVFIDSGGDKESVGKRNDPVDQLFKIRKFYPSNADIYYLGNSNSPNDAGNVGSFDAFTYGSDYTGNTEAPKGHTILDPFNQDRSAASGVAGIPVVTSELRFKSIAFHNGRAFFAAPSGSHLEHGIYYSRTLVREEYISQLRPEADPTAEIVNELVATDGGFIPTPGIGEIYVLREIGNGVVIGASNGVWFLTGGDIDAGFTATSNRLVRLSKSGMLSAESYVEAEDSGYYFGVDGIQVISLTDVRPAVTDLTEKTIQTFYISISAESRRLARGVYLQEQRKVVWAYADAAADADVVGNSRPNILVLDLALGGFYTYTVATQTGFPEIVALSKTTPIVSVAADEALTDNSGVPLTLNDDTTVLTTAATATTSQITALKALTMVEVSAGNWQLTFSEFNDRTFHDWRTFDPAGVGLNYSSFVEFGYNNFGTEWTRGTANWIHSYFSKDSKNFSPGYYQLPELQAPNTGGELFCTPGSSIVLCLDVSNSILSSGQLESTIKPAIKDFVTNLLGISGVSIAVDAFSTDVAHIGDFSSDEATIHGYIDSAYTDPIAGLSTAVGGGIRRASTTLSTVTAPVAKVMYVITDGVGNVPILYPLNDGKDAADAAKGAGYEVYVAGTVGRDGYNDMYLETIIASTPEHFVQINDFASMAAEFAKVASCPKTTDAPEDYLNTVYATNWRMTPMSLDTIDSRVEWMPGLNLYVALSDAPNYGNFPTPTIFTSPDGITWTSRDDALDKTTMLDVAHDPVGNVLVAVGTQFPGGGATNGIRRSTDGGVTWAEVNAPVDSTFRSVIWSADDSLFVAAAGTGSTSGAIITSPDGLTWTIRHTGKGWTGVEYSPSLGLYVTVPLSGGDIGTSSDALTWSITASALVSTSWINITWSASVGRFVAVSIADSTTQGIAYSSDGTTWTPVNSPGTGDYGRNSVKWFDSISKFVSVADDNAQNIISSADGITWAQETALVDWPVNTELVDIASKSATEWVLLRRDGIIAFYSIAAPF